jgi:hypothetical protein
MRTPNRRHLNGTAGVALAALFAGQGLLFLWQAGLQADEVMFLAAVFDPVRAIWSWDGPLGRIPLMLMPYLGATKSLVWAAFAPWAPAGPLFVRLPAVLMGAVTVYLVYRLIAKLVSAEGALISAGLLAVDTAYIISSTYDWAPAAVQTLCVTLAAVLIAARGGRVRMRWALIGILFGLLVWNKAIALFNLAGFAIAALACLRGRIRIERGAAISGALGFLVGCLPLIVYNATHDFATWGVRETFVSRSVGFKLNAAFSTFDASVFNGYVFATDGAPLWMPRHNLMPLALLACAGCFFLVKAGSPGRRVLAFAWVALIAAFALMLPFRNAGSGPQHILLLYPLPQIIIGTTTASLVSRMHFAARIGVLAVALSCLAVTGAYAMQGWVSGFSVTWTDAVYRLRQQLARQHVRRVIAADWGIAEPLIALSRERIACTPAYTLNADSLKEMAETGALVVRHTDAAAIEPWQTADLRRLAGEVGIRLDPVSVVHDPHGRAVFEIDALSYAGTRDP